jgi:hypothetical protein
MARGTSRLDFGAGSFANPYAGLQEAIGDISKSYLQREALDREEKRLVAAQEREDKRWDAQQARLDVADRRALDQYNERLNREDARNVILDQRYSTEAAQKQKLFDKQMAEYEKKTREEAALNNALANPVGARSALDIAKADVETSLGEVMPEIEKHLAQMSPEERKIAREGAIAPLARDVLKTLTKEDYEAQEYDRLFNKYKEMGTPAASIPTLVERDLKIGQVKSPDLMSRADVAASLKAETEKAKELLKSELDVAKLGDGNKLSVGEDGQLTVSTGKGTFAVGGKPMDIGTAASKFEDKMKGSAWWSDPNNRDFDKLMDTAVKGITSTVTDQKQKDLLRTEAYKALTPEVLSQFVAAKGKDATTLGDLITEQIRLNREGLGTEPGKELSGLIAAKNKYQELLQRGARPTYTGSLSRLTDASELDTLVGNTQELNNRVVPRTVLTQPSTKNETSVPALKAEVPDTEKSSYLGLEAWTKGDNRPEIRQQALKDAADIALAEGTSKEVVANLVGQGNIDALLARASRGGSSAIGSVPNKLVLAGKNILDQALATGSLVGQGLGMGYDMLVNEANARQAAAKRAPLFIDSYNNAEESLQRLNAVGDKNAILAKYGLVIPTPQNR